MKITLKKAFEFEGKKYESVDLDLDKLTGNDLIQAEREAAVMLGRPSTDLDKTYQACVAAKASGIVADVLCKMPARDFAAITSEVQGFLLGV